MIPLPLCLHFWEGGSKKGQHVGSNRYQKQPETTEVPDATASSLPG
jgi:hypothetical protein